MICRRHSLALSSAAFYFNKLEAAAFSSLVKHSNQKAMELSEETQIDYESKLISLKNWITSLLGLPYSFSIHTNLHVLKYEL